MPLVGLLHWSSFQEEQKETRKQLLWHPRRTKSYVKKLNNFSTPKKSTSGYLLHSTFKKLGEEKTSVCTRTRGGSETSLNTVVPENVKVYEPVCEIVFDFLKFFQKLPSAYIFINCPNLSKLVKFVKIVFDKYLNFLKLLNISKIF